MEKVYLKFRLEVLPGDYLLFQVLEMDERFRAKGELNQHLNIFSTTIPILTKSGIYLRGESTSQDFIPSSLSFEHIKKAKQGVLDSLSQFWKWEGFKEDFRDNTCKWYESTGKNGGTEYCFETPNNDEILLNYEIWQRDKFTFLKVNYANDIFRNVAFSEVAIKDFLIEYNTQPFIANKGLKFKGLFSEFDFNVDHIHSLEINFAFGNINNQVLKFLNKKLQPKQPELVDLGNSIYELRG